MSSKPPLPPQPPRVGALGSRSSTGASAAAAACSSRRRAATDLGNPAAIEMAKARTMQAAQERPVGLLETDLDEAVPLTTTTSVAAAVSVSANTTGKKTRSLLNLNHTSAAPRPRPEHALHVPQSPVAASHRSPRDDDAASTINQRPHKSMEFLLDKENLHFVKVSSCLSVPLSLAVVVCQPVLLIGTAPLVASHTASSCRLRDTRSLDRRLLGLECRDENVLDDLS